MDISIYTLPQDGAYHYHYENNEHDIRISTIPSYYGEGVSLRFYSAHPSQQKIENLGFSKPKTSIIQGLLDQPFGLILITGPTGSGKTTTLYSCIHYLIQKIDFD